MMYDRRDCNARAIHALKLEIAERLRPVCMAMPEEEFDQLVERIARLQHKYEQRSGYELEELEAEDGDAK